MYGRNNLTDIVRYTASQVFVPITVGGGIKSAEDVHQLLLAGADKIAVNTEATKRPQLLSEISERFGSQCLVLSIQAKRQATGKWEVYRDLGREHTGRDVVEWVEEAQSLGAGEILLTSIDQEGTQNGFDIELIQAVSKITTIPLIASGGMGELHHLDEAFQNGGADAVAMAHVLHYGKYGVGEIRQHAIDAKLPVRKIQTDEAANELS